ncbi:hypothetical protein BDV95DRAFT_489290 [Massariosphaeria phaeospora]|uniref:Uncharacterized protein n=1 Tax=Massariosphaeria phaeospora TaxID=100035 RepID=A0A7C8I9B7_9PLEO|nr:hypothetical protein BDV95DRAFT_489290 [Massariosphaeria phaeospora]
MASVSASLLDALEASTKNTIIDAFWGPVSTYDWSHCDDAPSKAYWDFYLGACEHALHDGGRHASARTHQDIIDIANLLQEHQGRPEIREALRCKLTKHSATEDELLDSSIGLAARLLLMIDVGSLQFGFSGRQQLQWHKGCLKDCIHSYFCAPPALGHEGVKLHRVFHALNLERIAGVDIIATDNLLDHLRLTEDDTKLYVFNHASLLKCQYGSSILPDGLVEETLRTLALLFPQSDPTTRKWVRKLPPPFSLDPLLAQCGHLKTDDRQIEKFTFWHDRLVVLKQVFDEATPLTMSQWWYDRRNGVQWCTFWVAIVVLSLTLFFGLIQSVEGALQVYVSYQGR